jgi:hypothetical protein
MIKHVVALMTATAIIFTVGTTAYASPLSVTLSGSPNDYQNSPASEGTYAQVDATLSGGVASGTLTTGVRSGSEIGGTWYVFEGTVTCMLDLGNRFAVGAIGSDRLVPEEAPPQTVPGTYAQLFTVTYGEFPNFEEVLGTPFHSSYGGTIGEHGGGVLSTEPPSCAAASYENHDYATHGSDARVSPSITTPSDGKVTHSRRVTFRGMGEPYLPIALYEVGHREAAVETMVDAEGRWSLTLTRIPRGVHTFTASAVGGSAIPANTVEIDVRR